MALVVPAVAGTEEIVKRVSGSAEMAGSDSVSLALVLCRDSSTET